MLFSTDAQRIVLLVEYSGREYSGSQLQANAYTVQQALHDALECLNVPHGAILFSGRTDAGVHAKGQVAHVDVPAGALAQIPELTAALNAVLPPSIAVQAHAMSEEPGFHATASAQWRWYRYKIYNQPYRSVWMPPDAMWLKHPLDAERMQQAARHLLGEHDFESFKCPQTDITNNVCHVIQSHVRQEGEIIAFDIVANRFIYKMVRNIMGVLIQIGLHAEFEPEDIPRILARKDRQAAGPAAKPEGLSLMAVAYPKPWDFFQNHVYVKTLLQVVQESSRHEKNLLRKAS